MIADYVVAFGRRPVSGERTIGQAFYECRISIVISGTGHRVPLEKMK